MRKLKKEMSLILVTWLFFLTYSIISIFLMDIQSIYKFMIYMVFMSLVISLSHIVITYYKHNRIKSLKLCEYEKILKIVKTAMTGNYRPLNNWLKNEDSSENFHNLIWAVTNYFNGDWFDEKQVELPEYITKENFLLSIEYFKNNKTKYEKIDQLSYLCFILNEGTVL